MGFFYPIFCKFWAAATSLVIDRAFYEAARAVFVLVLYDWDPKEGDIERG